MLSYISYLFDVFVTEIQGYINPINPTQSLTASFSYFTWFLVTLVAALLFLLMWWGGCHRRKRVAFAKVPSLRPNKGIPSLRRSRLPSVSVHSQCSLDTELPLSKLAPDAQELNKTDNQQAKFPVGSESASPSSDHGPQEPKPSIDSCKVKEGVKRKFEDESAPMTGKKTSQNTGHNPPRQPKEPPKRQHPHAYTYASPNRKMTEVTKSANTNIGSYPSDDVKCRWKGSLPKRFNKNRCRYAREALPTSLKRTAKDIHRRKQRHTKKATQGTLHTSSYSSPSSKPVFPQSTQSPPYLLRNAHSRSSPEKRKLGKRSKTLKSGANDRSGVIFSKGELQKGKDNYKAHSDRSTSCKTKETLAVNHNERSPKKVKKSSVLLKSKKLSGQKKARKVRKKHKFKEKMKSLRIETEKVRFPEKGISEKCYFQESYQGLHVPAVVRQVTIKGTKAESFTIKRTATPVLSSLLGQGAFRTCWPQSDGKSATRAQEHDGNGNTGRHNTNFLGPRFPEYNNETSEATHYSQTKHNIFWNKHAFNFSSQKGCGSNADTTTNASLVFAGRANSHQNSCFPVPNFQISKHTLDTQEYRNPFNVVNKKETNGECQNLRAGETRMNNAFKGSDKQRSLQFSAASHAEDLKQQTECCNPSDRRVYTAINPHDLNEKEGLPTKLKAQLPKEIIKEHGLTSKRHECVRLAINRNRYDIRLPEAWTQEGKLVHTSNQAKDSDVKVRREELGKPYFNQVAQCAQQVPCASVLTCDPENKQRLSQTEAILCEKRHLTNVKLHVDSKQQADAKPCFHNTDKFHTVALPQCPDNAIPVDLKKFRNLWKPRVTEEGSVFRLTKNHMLPSRFKYDNPENVEGCTKSQNKNEGNNYTWQDSQDKKLSMCCRHEARKGCSSRTIGFCTDVSNECSKQLYNTNAQSRKIKLNEQPQAIPRTIKDEQKCVDKHKAIIFGAGHAQKLIPRPGIPSKVHDRGNTLARSRASPVAEEFSDREIRVHDRLNQSSPSVVTTAGEASAAESEGIADRRHEGKGMFTQANQAVCVHCFKNQQVHDKGRVCDCRNHVVTFHDRDENHTLGHDHRREVECHKRQTSEHPTGKASVYHGHVVKRNKSLISVRNMLNELTSHLRSNQESIHPTSTAHVGKTRGKTLLYFKPTAGMRKDSLSPKEHDTSSIYKPSHYQAPRCSNTTEVTRDARGTGKYVMCYRSRRSKAFRHEPYRKRAPSSSESTVTPPSCGYHWTRNKNNCSPSRKGRYVLGPLVDKHVFPEQQHNSDVAVTEVSDSNSAIGQEDNRDVVNGGFIHSARKPDTMTMCDNSVQNPEENRSDGDRKTKECENTVFATPTFPKMRRIPEVITGKENVDLWNQDTSGQRQIRHASAWPAVTIQQVDGDFETVQGDTCRVSRRPDDAQHTCPAETRYKIIRQYCTGYPEVSHTVNRHISTGNVTKGDTIARYITKICTAERGICKRNTRTEYTDKGSAQTDHTCGSHKDRIAHTVRHVNPVDPIPESEEPVDDTNRKGTEPEDATSKHRHNEDSVTRQGSFYLETGNKSMADTAQQPAACVSMKRVSEVDTGADHSSDWFTTNKQTTMQNVNIKNENIGQHSTARNHDIAILCSDKDPKGTGSLQIAKKNDLQNERRSNQLTLNTLERATCSQIKTDTGTGVNELTNKNDDQPLFLSIAAKSESRPKATSRTGNSSYQYSRPNTIKTQLSLARLKASRGPLSMRYSASFDRNLRPSKAGVSSGTAGRLQFKHKQTPGTQSHTTQTENSINSAHVAVQTSPGLHVAARRASRHSKLRRYLANPKLYRDKIAQKECLFSKNRLSRKPGANVPDSLSVSASQPVQLDTREYFANRNLEMQKETLLESRARANDNQNITTVQAVTEKPLEQTVASIGAHKGLSTGQTGTGTFKDLSRNDKALNDQEMQNSLWNERRVTRCNFGTEKEVPDKKESAKQEAETSTDSRRQDDRWNDRTYNLEFSNTKLHGAQDKGHHDAQPSPHLDNKEKEKGTVGDVSCQTSKSLHAEGVPRETKLSTHGGASRSNRISVLTSSDSSTMSSRLSELNKYCVSRPIWKNANIEEIDRRVRRALKLREELKQTGASGSRARSLITSYFEASAAENAGKSPDGRSGASSTFASDLDATNRSAYPVSKDQQASFHDTGSDDTLCQNRDQMPITANRSSSSDDDHTKQGDAAPGSVGSEAAQSGASLRWAQKDLVSTGAAEQKTQDTTVCEHEQQHGRHSRAEYTSLLEETISESGSRVEKPSSTVASRRPSNSNSGNSIKRAAMRNKNSPPTKISKVENICNNTPRLVGALVQTLPQVPLSSFVEWFIETSDPNNFLLSDRHSSSSDNSPGDSPHCAFEERTPVDDQANSKMWQAILFNEQHERNSFGKNSKQPRPVSIAAHRKVCLQDKPTSNQSEERVPLFDGLKPHCFKEDRVPTAWKNNMPQSLSSTFPSTASSATYGISTLSGNTGEQSDSGRNSDTKNIRQRSFVEAVKEANVSNYQLKTKGDEHLSDNIMKELCAKFAFKNILGNNLSASNLKSKHRQTERIQTSREISTSASQKHTVPSEEVISTDSFNDNSYFQPADAGTHSHPVSKAHLQYLPQTTDDFSSGQITQSESTEESFGNCTSKYDKTGRVDSGAARTKDGVTDARITRAHEEKEETQSSVDSAGTSEQGDTNDKHLIRDVDVDSRCAPGIRHILMKLRQTADVDELPVAKTERTKITLRKCPDVTGIIARFQNIQP